MSVDIEISFYQIRPRIWMKAATTTAAIKTIGTWKNSRQMKYRYMKKNECVCSLFLVWLASRCRKIEAPA